MKVKVCGITTLDQLNALEGLGADFAGIIFYPGSKRWAGEKLGGMKQDVRPVPIKKIGVFVNEAFPVVLERIQDFGLHAVQLHGDEDPQFCQNLMDQVKVIKVFRLRGEEDIDTLVKPFRDCCHYFLFDTDTKGYGGSGRQFNWAVLEGASVGKPFFLSGGIGLADRERIQTFEHPYLEAVDINSSFETAPGVKDLQKVAQFISEIKGPKEVATEQTGMAADPNREAQTEI